MGKKLEIKVGDTFGRWTVLEEAEPIVYRCGNRNCTKRRVKVQCECGCQRTLISSDLKRGKSQGCNACARRKHGYFRHPLYHVIGDAIKRCHDKSDVNYGGRGISVCREWENDRGLFVEWGLAHGWEQGLDLDRINNNANYTPDNCRFVSRRENLSNRRITKKRDGTPLSEIYLAADAPKVKYNTFVYRVERGWDITIALHKKARKWRSANG